MNKPFIARDTGEPLVVLGGYKIGEGGKIIRDHLVPSAKPKAGDGDLDLLSKYGPQGLLNKGFHGVLDRLRNSGVIE